jgi:uncharacterized protein YndB with AHSA1/START domain
LADIRHSIQISAPAKIVYPLIASDAGLAQWWAEDVTKAGDAVELGFFKRDTVYRLRLRVDDPPHHAEWLCETGKEWSGTHLVFRMEAAGAGTLVRFTHADWEAETDYFVSCTTVWGELLFRLKAAAEGKPRGPLFLKDSLAY